MLKYIKTNKSITLYINNKPLMCSNSHVNWEQINELIKSENPDLEYLESLFHVENIILKSSKNIKIEQNKILYKNVEIHNVLVDKILIMINKNLDVKYMVKFLENLLENPSKEAINELYLFLEQGKLPISKDGCFYAYKKVKKDYTDIYSGTMDNSVGRTLKMKRDLVDDNREKTCSNGLHFCSYDYLTKFGSNEQDEFKILILKINPKDVVSIPKDYNNTKGRCCEYKVVQDITKDYIELSQKELLESKIIYISPEEQIVLDYFNFDSNQ